MKQRYKSLELSQLSAISRLFSPALLSELSRKGKSPLFSRLVNESSLLDVIDYNQPISTIFEEAFSLLKKKSFRHECIYKAAITHKVLLGKHSLNTAVMINEFRVGPCKADVVIFNGTSTVYEIKTERDSLTRLKKQISSYQKVFSKINIITGENHLESILSLYPEKVGILLLSDRYQISTIREAEEFQENLNSEYIFNSIQLIEAKEILKNLGIDTPRLPNTKIYGALEKLFLKTPPKILHNEMIKVLRNTRSQASVVQFVSSLPKSLQGSFLAASIKKQDQPRLLSVISTPIKEALAWG